MSDYFLTAEPRTLTGKRVNKVRKQGLVPGVLYGTGAAAVSLQFVARDLDLVVHEAGTSSLIALQIGEDLARVPVLLRDVQYDVIRHAIQHVDFLRVAMDEELTTDVEIVLVGHTGLLGTVVQDINTISVTCMPADLPPQIEANLGLLESLDGTLMVKDLGLPDTLTLHADPELSVVHVELYSMSEEEEETGAGAAIGSITAES